MLVFINFLFPSFLFALFAIAIPIIIHLFNFRRYKTVYFSNLKFLKNLQNETKSTSKLKHLLILIARILAITCLVLAFAQPFIPNKSNAKLQNQNIVSIYIDNSFSMDGESKFGKMIEVAKKKSRDIADAYPSDTKFLLLTNDYNPKFQEPINKAQFIDYISNLTVCPETKNLSEIISKQQDIVNGKVKKKSIFYILSDFQKTTSDLKNIKNDTNTVYQFLPLSTQTTNNIYIDSCWYDSPVRKLNQQEELSVKIVNNSDESYRDIPVKLFINDTLKSLSNFNIDENSSQTIKLSYNNMYRGVVNGRVEIVDYPITFDNTFYFSYTIANKIKLFIINESDENKYLNTLFNEDNYIEYLNNNNAGLDYSVFSNYNVIVLNELKEISSGLSQEIKNFANTGGSVVFIPKIDGDIKSYNAFLSNFGINNITEVDTHKVKITNINYESLIMKNVFKKRETNIEYPIANSHFTFANQTKTINESIISTDKKDNILAVYPYSKAKFYIWAIPFNDKYTNITRHPIFVPVMYNIALNSLPEDKIYYIIGENEIIAMGCNPLLNDEVYHIKNKTRNIDFIPEQKIDNANIKLLLHQNIKMADNYRVTYNDKILKSISFNYMSKESDQRVYSKGEISDILKNNGINNFSFLDVSDKYLSKTIKDINQGIKLWRWFIIFTLVFIGIEIAIIRLFK